MSEDQNVEYKESWRDEHLKTICGFANARGGTLLIGVNDQGKLVGVTGTAKLLEDIPNKISNHLNIIVDVNARTKEGLTFLEIVVPPSDLPISFHGEHHYRSGSTKQVLRGNSLQQFLLKKLGRSWDDQIVDDAMLADIDEVTVRSFLNAAVRAGRMTVEGTTESVQNVLRSLHLVDSEGKLKAAALLFFGNDPTKFFPHAYLKIGLFGNGHHDLRAQDLVKGNLFRMAPLALELLKQKYLQREVTYIEMQRIEKLDYPEAALREALMNAIVHKFYGGTTIQISVYPDQLIIWNPGELPEELTIQELKQKHASHPRNKILANLFFQAGYIETWGRGIPAILDSCQAHKLPEPEMRQSGGGFEISFFKDRLTTEYLTDLGLNERQLKAVQHLKTKNRITNKLYQELNAITRNTATLDLNDLIQKKIIIRFGKGAGAYYILSS